jgi:hypothetical protein
MAVGTAEMPTKSARHIFDTADLLTVTLNGEVAIELSVTEGGS